MLAYADASPQSHAHDCCGPKHGKPAEKKLPVFACCQPAVATLTDAAALGKSLKVIPITAFPGLALPAHAGTAPRDFDLTIVRCLSPPGVRPSLIDALTEAPNAPPRLIFAC